MECPKCGGKAVSIGKDEYRKQAGEPITEVRRYVCLDWDCETVFRYRNVYMGESEKAQARKYIKMYERMLEKQRTGQEELFEG